MMELIDLHELSEWILNWIEKNHYYHPFSKSNNIPIGELNDILNQIPRIDAVPVIRCKDCKYASMTYDGECKYCDIWFPDEAIYIDGDHFCSAAERKEND